MKRKRNEGGFAMLMAVALVFVVGFGAAQTWRHLHATHDAARAEARLESARHLAEAGLATAAARLRADADYRGESGVALGGGVFSVVAAPLDAPGRYRVTAIGAPYPEAPVHRRVALRAELRVDAAGARFAAWERLKRGDALPDGLELSP